MFTHSGATDCEKGVCPGPASGVVSSLPLGGSPGTVSSGKMPTFRLGFRESWWTRLLLFCFRYFHWDIIYKKMHRP